MPVFKNLGRGGGRIGTIVPSTNRNLEPDFFLLAPAGVSLHFVRVSSGEVSAIPDSVQMQKYARSEIELPTQLLVDARVDVIAYGCTSATLSSSPEFDETLSRNIESLGGIPTVTAAGALLEAVGALGVSKAAFVSPYVRELHEGAMTFLTTSGLDIVSEQDVGCELNNYEQEMSPRAVYDLASRADSKSAEVVILSCTEMRAVEAIAALELDLGKPVVTSNQALMYACAHRIGADLSQVKQGGQLFQHR